MFGENIEPRAASANTSLTAAGTGDNTAITGAIFDTASLKFPGSLAILIHYVATLAAAATLKLKSATIQHGDAANLSDAAAFATLETTGSTIATGGAGGSTEGPAVKAYNVNLAGAKRYIRFDFTPDLSAGSADTAKVAAVVVFGNCYKGAIS